MKTSASSQPLLIFGFDAANGSDLVEWAQQGHLPALASVLERGAWAETGGNELLSEHGTWMPLLSGISRGAIGYYYFRQLMASAYAMEPKTGADFDVPMLWQRLSPGRKIAIIDVPEVLPKPGLAGLQISNLAPHGGYVSDHPGFQFTCDPPGLQSRVTKFMDPADRVREKSDSAPAEDQAIYRQLTQRIEQKGAACRALLADDRYDLTAIVFAETHTAGHQFWKYRPAAVDSTDKRDHPHLRHAIREIHQAVDRELGRLLEQLPPDTNVLILSSVGIEDYYPTGGLTESFCRQLGYQVSPAPGPVSLKPMDLARRVVPESWRAAVSRVLFSRDQRERLLSDAFTRGTDWSRTTAFAIPTFYSGWIRVNLRGRELQGIVAPGREYEELLDRIEADLHQLTHPDTGAPAVAKISRPGELYGTVPPPVFPDLWVRYQPHREFWPRLHHPRAELTQVRGEFFRDSDHTQAGFIAAAGPGIRARGAQSVVDVLDVTPSCRALLGEPPLTNLAGHPLQGWLDE